MFVPRASQPGLDGQYLRPWSTKWSPSRSAITPMPAGLGRGTSKFAVPPGVPAASLAAQPPRYSPEGSDVASRRKRHLILRAIPHHRHQPETVTQHGTRETRIDNTDFLCCDDEIDIRHSPAAVLSGIMHIAMPFSYASM